MMSSDQDVRNAEHSSRNSATFRNPGGWHDDRTSKGASKFEKMLNFPPPKIFRKIPRFCHFYRSYLEMAGLYIDVRSRHFFVQSDFLTKRAGIWNIFWGVKFRAPLGYTDLGNFYFFYRSYLEMAGRFWGRFLAIFGALFCAKSAKFLPKNFRPAEEGAGAITGSGFQAYVAVRNLQTCDETESRTATSSKRVLYFFDPSGVSSRTVSECG